MQPFNQKNLASPASHASVSIIIAAHNAGRTIERAVRSALAEMETADVIIIDDASTDDTVARALSADDGSGRLKLISLLKNSGPSAARNRAIRESSAPWIGVLDADDFFLPGRLKGLLAFANNADFIADDIWRVDEHAIEGARSSFLGSFLTEPRWITFKDFVTSNITDRRRQRSELGFIKPIMRRSFLEKQRLQYQDTMRLGEDYELYARALAHGAKLLLVPAQGYVSVIRAQSLSGKHSEEDLRQLRDCDEKLARLPQLKKDDRRALRRHYLSVDCRLQWRLLILAVKERQFKKILDPFLRPWPIPFCLLRQLFEQLVLRTGKRLGL